MVSMRSVAVVLLASCSVTTEDAAVRPEPLGALPPPMQVETARFRDAEACAQCHLVKDDTPVLHDGVNENVSPVLLWRATMMANAARDPYYLAVFAEEVARSTARGESPAAVEKLCTRCHGPAGHEELAQVGEHLTFAELTTGTSPAAVLARGGVTCSLCHQIAATGLGEESTFTGKFTVGFQRKIFGPYTNPLTNPMMLIVDYEPTYGAQIASAGLCATCHTVIVPTPTGEVVEQATFLEWRSSSFASGTASKTCQSCHVATVDRGGAAIQTAVSSFPEMLAPRSPVGRHEFVGGNSYLLRLLADATEWSGAGVTAAEFVASAERNDAHLATAARVTVKEMRREGSTLVAVVRVDNEAGHKLPTGYPSRRVWLHVTASSGGSVVWESGAPGALPAAQPHYNEISSEAEVQVYEATLVDVQGSATHRALDARRYSKDNRILPRGFAPTGSDRSRTEVVGVIADPTFTPGSDEVTYRMMVPAGSTLRVELLYQALRPETIEAIEAAQTPAGSRFVDLTRARPITTTTIATAVVTAP